MPERDSESVAPDYRPDECFNCGRVRVRPSGICEKCMWDNDKGDYVSVTGRCPYSADGNHKPVPDNNILGPPFMECEFCRKDL